MEIFIGEISEGASLNFQKWSGYRCINSFICNVTKAGLVTYARTISIIVHLVQLRLVPAVTLVLVCGNNTYMLVLV